MSLEAKTAFTCIARNKGRIIKRMLDSTNGIFDIYILVDNNSTDNTVKEFRNWCQTHDKECRVSVEGKDHKRLPEINVEGKNLLGDFAKARNISFEIAKNEGCKYAFWMDTDDVLEDSSKVVKVIELMDKNEIQMGLFVYNYAMSAEGKPLVQQKRERIINLEKKGKWVGRVHEVFLYDDPNFKANVFEDVIIVHQRSEAEVGSTARRNHLIMKKQEKEQGIESFTDKELWDIGFDHFEWKEYEEAIKYFEKLSNYKDLSKDKVFDSYLKLAYSYFYTGDIPNAVKYSSLAQDFDINADLYLLKAKISIKKELYQDAIYYSDRVLELGKPQTFYPVNDYDYTTVPLQIKLLSYIRLNDIDNAMNAVRGIMKLSPGDMNTIQQYNELKLTKNRKEFVNSVAKIVEYLESVNKIDKTTFLKHIVTDDLKEDPTLKQILEEIDYDYKNKVVKQPISTELEVDFVVGPHFEKWNGKSDIEKGIGGSEGMVIQMAKELSKNGCKVKVYCETDGGVFNGVEYLDWRRWNPSSPVDVFIGVRGFGLDMMKHLIEAKRKYLWLHDTHYHEVPLIQFYSADKVFVLSDFHQDIIRTYHGIIDESIFYKTRNALNIKALNFVKKQNLKRDMRKIIWASSYDRGLDFVLENWAEIKQNVPAAELNIFYGWELFDKFAEDRNDKSMYDYKKKIEKLMKQKGIVHHGRVSQKELYAHFATSNIWFYPTLFQEISCINAMTAQALGAFPVVCPTGALAETVNGKFGIKSSRDSIVKDLIYMMTHQNEFELKREKMMEWAENEFDARTLAKEWISLFRKST